MALTGSDNNGGPTELTVTISSGASHTVHTVLIRRPADAPIAVAVTDLLSALRARGADGVGGSDYVLRCDRLGRVLADNATLVSEGVSDGNALYLVDRTQGPDAQPAQDAGTPPGSFGDLEGDESAPDERAPAEEGQQREGRAEGHQPGDQEATWSRSAVRADGLGGRVTSGGRRHRLAIVILVAVVAGGIVLALPAAQTDHPQTLAPRFKAGRWVQLASFRESASATRFARRLTAHGVSATVLASDDIEELYPDWQVVAVGPLASAAAQRRMIRRAQQAGFPGAEARAYTPVLRPVTASQLAGTYRGMLRQLRPGHRGRSRRIAARVSLTPTGSGTMAYRRPACTGKLTVEGAQRGVMMWRERIVAGPCASDGRWTMRTSGGRLVLTGRWPSRTDWLAGRLDRAG